MYCRRYNMHVRQYNSRCMDVHADGAPRHGLHPFTQNCNLILSYSGAHPCPGSIPGRPHLYGKFYADNQHN